MGPGWGRDPNAGRTWGALLFRRQLRMEWKPPGAEGWGCCMRGWVWWCLRWLRSLCAWADTRNGLGVGRDVLRSRRVELSDRLEDWIWGSRKPRRVEKP
ncbi:hypothetical protein FJTKL_13433 [Diaporthe vaccinii]|uniref:Uncharacterized protein n=1 Tax=Diaporthe vaccinii TaxID=105482 RepID=A0ABR4EA94_9PEZI